jgi:hypothetical protein
VINGVKMARTKKATEQTQASQAEGTTIPVVNTTATQPVTATPSSNVTKLQKKVAAKMKHSLRSARCLVIFLKNYDKFSRATEQNMTQLKNLNAMVGPEVEKVMIDLKVKQKELDEELTKFKAIKFD